MMPVVRVGRRRWKGKNYVEPAEVTKAKAIKSEKARRACRGRCRSCENGLR